MALLTRQITPWQEIFKPPRERENAWQTLSTTLYSKILEPMWWCCRGPRPVTLLEKDSLYWLCLLVQDPTPIATNLWVASVKFRYEKLTGKVLVSEVDKFLMGCFTDFASINQMYNTSGGVNWKE